MSTNKNRTIVLYTLNPWKHSLPILRVIGPAQQAGFKVIPGNRMEIVSPRLVSAADIVVIQRDFPRLTKPYLEIWERAREANKPIVFDLDDLLLDIPANHIDFQNEYYRDAYLPMMQAMLDADHISASTAGLAEYMREFNPAVSILPNFLNDNIWRLRQPKPVEEQNGPIIIGYMGSNTHFHDLGMIEQALIEILHKYKKRVLLKILGLRPPEGILSQPNAEWIPLNEYDYSIYANYLTTLDCDIAIAPLEDQLFNRSKSCLKYLEYGALGLPGIYSKLPVLEAIIRNGANGFLASTLDDWTTELCELIEDPNLRAQMAVQAQQTVQQGWLLSQNTTFLENFYENILPSSQPSTSKAYPYQSLEQTWIDLRMTLTPPGSMRERVAYVPVRAMQIMNNEGFDGMLRRYRESTGRAKDSGASPMLFQRETSTGERHSHHLLHAEITTTIPFEANSENEASSLNKASIIVLTYNNINYTRLCLRSIFEATVGMDYEVIAVDNASTDGTQVMLQDMAAKIPSLKIILNSSNQGFARGNNQGAAAAKGDLLVFLNNDTVVTPGWLTGLAKYLQIPQVGMAGPVTNSSGNESCIDLGYRNLEEMRLFAKNYTAAHSGQAFEISMLAFLCVGLRRSVYEEIGILDEQFGLGMFEDDDYAIRLRQKNYHIICAQDVFIHHWGSASFSRLPSKKFYIIFNQNYKKFEKKWGKKGLAHV